MELKPANQTDDELYNSLVTWGCYSLIAVAVMLGGFGINFTVIARLVFVPEAIGYKIILSVLISAVWLLPLLFAFNPTELKKFQKTNAGKSCACSLIVLVGIGLLISGTCVVGTNLFSSNIAERCQMERITPDRRRFICSGGSDIVWYEAKDGDLLLHQVPPK